MQETMNPGQDPIVEPNHDADPRLQPSTLRVEVQALDELLNLVGELVLIRNEILQTTARRDDASFQRACQRLDLLTMALQQGVMRTRMEPIGSIWSGLPTLVRETAESCGKHVRITLEGHDTELDKGVLDQLREPLANAVRAIIEHGIEAPAECKPRGKPVAGCIRIAAFHEGGQANLEITDDRNCAGSGAGSPPHPALNVLRGTVERIGGTIDLLAATGEADTVRIRIPLTLAIIPALIVTSGGERYAIPQANLLELVRLDGRHARECIDNVHGAPVYRLRGKLLPLAHLDLELGHANTVASARSFDRDTSIVVLRADGCQFGLVVESNLDTEEIVVKPLGRQFKGIQVFAGAAIMGDGRVAMILDVAGLARKIGMRPESQPPRSAPANGPQGASSPGRVVLLAEVGLDARVAVELASVERLEEIPVTAIERACGREVVQYRGDILPLVRLAPMLNIPDAPATRSSMDVIVVRDPRCGHVGLVVSRILDVVDAPREALHCTSTGIHQAATLQGRVTNILDIQSLLAHPADRAPQGMQEALVS